MLRDLYPTCYLLGKTKHLITNRVMHSKKVFDKHNILQSMHILFKLLWCVPLFVRLHRLCYVYRTNKSNKNWLIEHKEKWY